MRSGETYHHHRAGRHLRRLAAPGLRAESLRADRVRALVDLAVANPSFTVRKVETELGISYSRANKLVGQLCDLGILRAVDPDGYKRLFYAPRVLQILTTQPPE